MNSTSIIERQNKPCMLKIQYAARVCYNNAEKLNYIVWFFCLISAFSIFFPDSLPYHLSFAVPFVADIAAWVLMNVVNRNVKKAAELRKYFDAYSIDIAKNQFSEAEERKLIELAEDKYAKNPKQAELQIKNTGSDYPPGVYDWYKFSTKYEGLKAKFECQCQNTWWDKKQFPLKCIVKAIAFVMVVTLFIVLMIHNNFVKTLLCSAGLLIKLAERIIDGFRYWKVSIEIDGAQKMLEAHLTSEGIKELQILIDKRRAVNILGINLLHKKSANKLTKRYDDITNPR